MPSGRGPSAPSPCKPRLPLSPAFPCSLPPSFSRRGIPSRKRAAASGPARLPRGQSPRRPSLVDSLCRRVSIISILKKLRCNRLFECSSISTASDPTHVCRSAPDLVLKTKKKRAADAALFLNRYIWRQSYASLKNFFLPTWTSAPFKDSDSRLYDFAASASPFTRTAPSSIRRRAAETLCAAPASTMTFAK